MPSFSADCRISFAIPTLSFPSTISDLLRSINAASEYVDIVSEVCISINCNPSVEILESLQELGCLYEHISIKHVFVGEGSPIPVNKNVSNAVDLCQGEYFWLFSDDDLLAESALQIVLGMITNSDHPAILVTNFGSIDSKGKMIDRNIQGWKRDICFLPDQYDDSIAYANFSYGLFSVNIVKKEMWMKNKCYGELSIDGYDFMVIIPAIFMQGKTCFLHDVNVYFRKYQKVWELNYSSTFIIDHFVIPRLLDVYNGLGYSKGVLRRILDLNATGLIQSAYALRLSKKNYIVLYLLSIKTFFRYPKYYAGILVFFVPRKLLRLLRGKSCF